MIEDGRYVGFNRKPLELLGYVLCEKVNDSYVKKARILIAKNGTKSIIGRERLSTMRYKLVSEDELKVNALETEIGLSAETKQFIKEFPKLFERKGKMKNHQVRINFKPCAKITQQEGRRTPNQLQKAVDEEIGRLLKEGHIEKSMNQKMTFSFNQQR